MPLVNIVVVLIVARMALWLVNRFIPMASGIKTILNVVVTIAVGVRVLQATGLWGPISNYRFTAKTHVQSTEWTRRHCLDSAGFFVPAHSAGCNDPITPCDPRRSGSSSDRMSPETPDT
jgi:hypothetical protein